jgi:hypothetical protein
LQAGDYVEVPEVEHRITDQWLGLPVAVVSNLDRCLLRTVQILVRDKATDVAMLPSVGFNPSAPWPIDGRQCYMGTLTPSSDWLSDMLKGRKVAAVVNSFELNQVVQQANVILNTSDLRRVQLERDGKKRTFDLTAQPAPDVWLHNGDVITIPERE